MQKTGFLSATTERPLQQRLEQVLRLALCLALLGTQPLEFADDGGESLLVPKRWNRDLEGTDLCKT